MKRKDINTEDAVINRPKLGKNAVSNLSLTDQAKVRTLVEKREKRLKKGKK